MKISYKRIRIPKTTLLPAIVMLVTLLPVTILLLQEQQEIRSRASTLTAAEDGVKQIIRPKFNTLGPCQGEECEEQIVSVDASGSPSPAPSESPAADNQISPPDSSPSGQIINPNDANEPCKKEDDSGDDSGDVPGGGNDGGEDGDDAEEDSDDEDDEDDEDDDEEDEDDEDNDDEDDENEDEDSETASIVSGSKSSQKSGMHWKPNGSISNSSNDALRGIIDQLNKLISSMGGAPLTFPAAEDESDGGDEKPADNNGNAAPCPPAGQDGGDKGNGADGGQGGDKEGSVKPVDVDNNGDDGNPAVISDTPAAGKPGDEKCIAKKGTCGTPASCTADKGHVELNLCSGGTNNVCCVPGGSPQTTTGDEKCTAKKGTCGTPQSCTSDKGHVEKNLCSGGTNNVCCVPGAASGGTAPVTEKKKTITDTSACTADGGSCMDRTACTNGGGTVKTGLCPGGVNNICCKPKANATPCKSDAQCKSKNANSICKPDGTCS